MVQEYASALIASMTWHTWDTSHGSMCFPHPCSFPQTCPPADESTSWQAVLGELDARIRVAPRSTAQPFSAAAATGSKEHMRTLQCTIALRHLALKMCKDAPRLLSQAAKAQESFSSLLMSEHEPQGAVAQ